MATEPFGSGGCTRGGAALARERPIDPLPRAALAGRGRSAGRSRSWARLVAVGLAGEEGKPRASPSARGAARPGAACGDRALLRGGQFCRGCVAGPTPGALCVSSRPGRRTRELPRGKRAGPGECACAPTSTRPPARGWSCWGRPMPCGGYRRASHPYIEERADGLAGDAMAGAGAPPGGESRRRISSVLRGTRIRPGANRRRCAWRPWDGLSRWR